MKPTTIDYVFWPAPVRRYSFREHLTAAEAGGFTSLAVAPEAYRQAISSGLSAKDMVAMASDKGVALRHLDTLTDWAPIRVPSEIDAGLRSRFDVSADECFAICEALGLGTILAVAGYDKGAIPLDILVDGFGRLCDRATVSGSISSSCPSGACPTWPPLGRSSAQLSERTRVSWLIPGIFRKGIPILLC